MKSKDRGHNAKPLSEVDDGVCVCLVAVVFAFKKLQS